MTYCIYPLRPTAIESLTGISSLSGNLPGMSGATFIARAMALAFALFVLPICQSMPAFAQKSASMLDGIKFPGMEADTELRHLQLLPFNVPVIRNNKLEFILSIGVTIEVKGAENKTKIMDQTRQLRDAFLRDLHGIASIQRADGKVLDANVVKSRLMTISTRMFGPGIVENILVYGITSRSL